MHRKNNFDFLRFIFASIVIITHSFILSGLKDCDWLCQVTNNQLSFSYLGVKGFFIISGYLIFQSLERSKSLLEYFWKRFLRVFPGLAVVLLLTILLGPIVYDNTVRHYLENKSMWTYFPNNLSLYNTQYAIHGIFTGNPYKSDINGSLWTIAYEFTMYIALSLLFVLRKKALILTSLLLVVFVFLVTGNIFFIELLGKYGYILNAGLMVDLSVFFVAGSLLASLKIETYKYSGFLALISFLLLVVSLVFHFFDFVKFFAFPVFVIYCGVNSFPFINNIGDKIGDLSYGIYIYGFPVQQTLVYYLKPNYLQLMALALIISYLLAYLSWHLIEANALKFKKIDLHAYFKKWIPGLS